MCYIYQTHVLRAQVVQGVRGAQEAAPAAELNETTMYWPPYIYPGSCCAQVVQVCAEHKKPRKLLKHLDAARAASQRQRHPPRCLIFTNKVPRGQG